MIKIASLPNAPSRRSMDFELDEFNPPRFARVIYVPQANQNNHAVIEMQAFEIDSAGNFAFAPNGAPSRTPGTQHTLPLSGLGDTVSLQAGWIRVAGNYDDDNLPPGTDVVETLPETAAEGALAWWNDKLYKWSAGMIEETMRKKGAELIGILRSAALADLQL